MLKKVQDLLKRLRRKRRSGAMFPGSWRVEDTSNLTEVAIAHRLHFTREIRQPLLLISEVQRSGGSFLSQLLDNHPQIYGHPYELKIGKPIKYNWPKLDLTAGPEVWWESLKEKQVIVSARTGYRKIGVGTNDQKALPFIFSQPLQKKLFVRMAASYPKPPTQRQVLDAYVTSYFNAWVDYQAMYRDPEKVKYWCAFVPRLTMAEDQCAAFFQDYPDGFLLSVIRNPLSWFASANRHRSFEYKLEEATEIWLDSTRSALRNLARYPGRVALLHFDDLVKNTEATMRALCAQAGLDFDSSLLMPTFNGLPMAANTSFKPAEPGTIIKASVERGKELKPEDAAYIRERTDATYKEALNHTVVPA